jgi:hypothetical protein
MPNCSANCATEQTALGSAGTANAGVGLIFRGGDTWHEGNSSLTPYTGGTFNNIWSGGGTSTCAYEGTQTGCFYIGVDTTWYNSSVCGSSWCRPILTGDNPPSTTPVASCAYQTGAENITFTLSNNENTWIYFDSFELTGFCAANTTVQSGDDIVIQDSGTGVYGHGMNLLNNIYIHGWTITTGTSTNTAIPCVLLTGGANVLWSMTRMVIDGSDSVAGGCLVGFGPAYYHFKDSIWRYTTDGVGDWCHDIHDNIFEHWYGPTYGDSGGHGSWASHPNTFECNEDSAGNSPDQPNNTPNVFYNNIIRHDDPSNVNIGAVHLWFCPTTIPEYWFNNLVYDIENSNYWDYAGEPAYGCPTQGSGSGPQVTMFNNTLVDGTQPCYLGNVSGGGGPLTVLNEHLINTSFDSPGTYNVPCTGLSSATNVAMTDAAATTQGYTTGSGGTDGGTNTCANEAMTPCTPTASTNATVRAGTSTQSYCATLASYTTEPAISTDAANACKYGTTDGCLYNTLTHTMNCNGPVPTPVKRGPTWDSGAYQFSGMPSPTNLTGTAVVQ